MRSEYKKVVPKDFEVDFKKFCQSGSEFSSIVSDYEKNGGCGDRRAKCDKVALTEDCLADLKKDDISEFQAFAARKLELKGKYSVPVGFKKHVREENVYLTPADWEKKESESLKTQLESKARQDIGEQINRSKMTTLAFGCCLKSECKSMLDTNNALLKAGADKASGSGTEKKEERVR